MAIRYVDFVNGSDANGGQGPDASNGSSTLRPWKTIGKALGASGIASGDTVYVAPGTQRETVTVAMTSATVETQILADPQNIQGFKDSGGVLVPAGPVVWTAYTTNDTTTPAAASLLTLAARDFLTFQGFLMVGGNNNASCVDSNTTNSTNITFRECFFIPGKATQQPIVWTGLADVSAHWLFDRCMFLSSGGIHVIGTAPTSAIADYDLDFVFQNCLFIAGSGSTSIQFGTSGASAFKPGGVKVWNCTFIGGVAAVNLTGTSWSTSILSTAYNCVVLDSNGLSCGSSGPLVEDYNLLWCSTPRSNVAAGTHSVVGPTYALTLELGQSDRLFGMLPRPFGMPSAGSGLLGFGNQAGAPAVDFLNRARPSGGGSISNAIGYLERHDTAAKETGTTDAGSVGLVITGPGDQDLAVAVDAAAATISIRARYDSSHAATNKPQVLLLANGEIGVAAQTLTMTAAADTWETLTTASFTPTRAGVVKIRLVSRSAAGGGKAFFDTAVIT